MYGVLNVEAQNAHLNRLFMDFKHALQRAVWTQVTTLQITCLNSTVRAVGHYTMALLLIFFFQVTVWVTPAAVEQNIKRQMYKVFIMYFRINVVYFWLIEGSIIGWPSIFSKFSAWKIKNKNILFVKRENRDEMENLKPMQLRTTKTIMLSNKCRFKVLY